MNNDFDEIIDNDLEDFDDEMDNNGDDNDSSLTIMAFCLFCGHEYEDGSITVCPVCSKLLNVVIDYEDDTVNSSVIQVFDDVVECDNVDNEIIYESISDISTNTAKSLSFIEANDKNFADKNDVDNEISYESISDISNTSTKLLAFDEINDEVLNIDNSEVETDFTNNFAKELPEWSITPPNILVKRK